MNNLEKLVQMYGSNGFSVGNSLTWADLVISEVVFSILNKHSNSLNNYWNLKQIYQNVMAIPNVADFIKNPNIF